MATTPDGLTPTGLEELTVNDETTAAETVEQAPVYTIEFIFKSGASTTVKVADFTVTGSGYKWTHGDGEDKLMTIDPDEVAAIIQRGVGA
jgi:hypothetical protein